MKFRSCKKITALFLSAALIGVTCFTNIRTVTADNGNLALNKPVYSNGVFNGAFVAKYAVDGVTGTHYASGSQYPDKEVPDERSTIIVDFEKEYDIDTVIVRTERDMDRGGYSRAGWSVYLSTELNFENATLIATKTTPGNFGEDLEIELEKPVCGRYLKITSTTLIVLSEIEAYGELPSKGVKSSYSLKSYNDLETDNAAQLVPYLGILEGASHKEFKPLELLKRKDAAKSAVSLVNLDAGESKKCFQDVNEEDEYCAYINAALSVGIVSYAENFRPDDYVTISEFYTMILRALGYGEYAVALNSYPAGSMMAAQKIGLDNDVELDGNEYVSRKSALYILYNALMSSVMENSKISEEGISFDYGKKNKTVLEKYFHLDLFDGIVTANNASTLNDVAESNPENIAIDGKIYRDLTYSAYNAIGKNICFIVSSDDGNGITVWWENKEVNKTYEIECGDLESVSRSYVKCYVNGTNQKKQFNITNADILKNGSACADYAYDLESFKHDDSYIVLIDNDSDGIIEVVNIMQPTVIPVDSFSLNDKDLTAIGKNGENIRVENYDNVDVMINGTAGKRRKLSESAVIYAYLPQGNKNILIDGYSTVIEKEIESIGTDSVTIDGIEYEFSDYYKKNRDKMGKISVGSISKCAIGKDNKLVWVDINYGTNSLEKLGFILRTNEKDNKKTIRVFNEDSSFVTLEIADKVKIDGATVKANYIFENPKTVEKKYAVYKLDSEGKIKWIDTENYDSAKEADSKMYKVSGLSSDSSRSHANAIFNEFKMVLPIKSDMKVFTIPYSNGEIMTSAEYEKYYFISKYSSTFSSIGLTLDVNDAFYWQDENGFPLFASRGCRTSDDITTGNYSSCSKYSPVMVVKKITRGVNSNSDESYCISGYDFRNGSSVKYFTNTSLTRCINTSKIFADKVIGYINGTSNQINDTKIDDEYLINISDIKAGDIIKYDIVNNIIIGLEVICERNIDSEYRFGDEIGYPHATYRYMCGVVNDIGNGLIKYEMPNGPEVREENKFRFFFVCEKDKNGKDSVSIISSTELAAHFSSGQRCIVYLNGGKPVSMIIYN